MKSLLALSAAMAMALPGGAQAQARFERPDCSAYKAEFKAESKCIREIRKSWQEANFAALQKTSLMFNYMTRPDIATSAAAKAAIDNKVEGSFTIRFSVRTDGTVYNVRMEYVTDGIAPLASLWADTIGQWTFARTDQAVSDLEYRRIYMYSAEDDAKSPQVTKSAH